MKCHVYMLSEYNGFYPEVPDFKFDSREKFCEYFGVPNCAADIKANDMLFEYSFGSNASDVLKLFFLRKYEGDSRQPMLKEPIYTRGNQGLWNFPDEEIMRRLA